MRSPSSSARASTGRSARSPGDVRRSLRMIGLTTTICVGHGHGSRCRPRSAVIVGQQRSSSSLTARGTRRRRPEHRRRWCRARSPTARSTDRRRSPRSHSSPTAPHRRPGSFAGSRRRRRSPITDARPTPSPHRSPRLADTVSESPTTATSRGRRWQLSDLPSMSTDDAAVRSRGSVGCAPSRSAHRVRPMHALERTRRCSPRRVRRDSTASTPADAWFAPQPATSSRHEISDQARHSSSF